MTTTKSTKMIFTFGDTVFEAFVDYYSSPLDIPKRIFLPVLRFLSHRSIWNLSRTSTLFRTITHLFGDFVTRDATLRILWSLGRNKEGIQYSLFINDLRAFTKFFGREPDYHFGFMESLRYGNETLIKLFKDEQYHMDPPLCAGISACFGNKDCLLKFTNYGTVNMQQAFLGAIQGMKDEIIVWVMTTDSCLIYEEAFVCACRFYQAIAYNMLLKCDMNATWFLVEGARAICNSEKPDVKLLLALVESQPRNTVDIFDAACSNGNIECITTILSSKYGRNVDLQRGLHCAVKNQRMDVVELLFVFGARNDTEHIFSSYAGEFYKISTAENFTRSRVNGIYKEVMLRRKGLNN
jgi:hypothetical protein